MKFYKITGTIEKKIIGKFPQIIGAIDHKNNTMNNKSFVELSQKGYINEKFNIFYPILDSKAIETDLLNGNDSFISLTISIKFYNYLLKIIKKDKIQSWKLNVYKGKLKFNYNKMIYEIENVTDEYDYILLYLPYPKKDFINYTESRFYSYSETENLIEYDKVDFLTQAQIKFYNKMYKKDKIKPKVNERKIIEDNLKFNNYKEFVEYRKNLKQKSKIYKITPLKLVFNTSNCTEDFFRITDNYNNTMGYYASERLKNEIEEKGFTGIEFLPLDKLSTAYDIETL